MQELPTYEGEPLSLLIPLNKWEGSTQPQLWVWEPLYLSGSSSQAWYRASSNTGERIPALLAFTIESLPEPQTIPMLNPFPVPQVGEYGIVVETETLEKELFLYNIQALPLESRQRWVALGDALRKLSEPLLWPPFSERIKLASDDTAYQNALHSFSVQRQLTKGIKDATTDLLVREAMLEASRKHIENLHAMLQKDNLAQWEEVQRMANNLAHDYYQHHLALTCTLETPEPSEPEQEVVQPYLLTDETVQLAQEVKTKVKRTSKGSRPMQTPTPIVARKQEAIPTLSDTLSRNLLPMLLEKDRYTLYENERTARYKQNLGKDRGNIIVDINPSNGEGWDNVQSALNMLGDEVVDAYCAVLAIGLEKNGVEHIREPFLLSPDDILEICGKVKSNRAYKPTQRAVTIGHIKTLSMITVKATLPLAGNEHLVRAKRGRPSKGETPKKEGTFIQIKGALIDLLSFKIGEYSTITGDALWERQSVSIGEWVTMIPDLNKRTAIMLRQVLKYSAKNEVYQKRIGRYLTLMFRTNASHGGTFPQGIRMGTLLEQSNITPDYHRPQEFRNAVIRALNRLKQDSVIGNYCQFVDSTQGGQEVNTEVQEQAHGWLDLWLQQKYHFSPPEMLIEQYKPVQQKANIKRISANTFKKKDTRLPE